MRGAVLGGSSNGLSVSAVVRGVDVPPHGSVAGGAAAVEAAHGSVEGAGLEPSKGFFAARASRRMGGVAHGSFAPPPALPLAPLGGVAGAMTRGPLAKSICAWMDALHATESASSSPARMYLEWIFPTEPLKEPLLLLRRPVEELCSGSCHVSSRKAGLAPRDDLGSVSRAPRNGTQPSGAGVSSDSKYRSIVPWHTTQRFFQDLTLWPSLWR